MSAVGFAQSNTFVFGNNPALKGGNVSVSMVTSQLDGEETIVETMINPDGSFIVPLEIQQAGIGIMTLMDDRYYLYLEPGNRLQFSFDRTRDKALQVEGDEGASECLCAFGDKFNFATKENSIILAPGTVVLTEHHENLKHLSPDERMAYIDGKRRDELAFADACSDASAAFRDYLKVFVNGKWLSAQLRYVGYQDLNDASKTSFHAAIGDFDLNDVAALDNPGYGVFIDNYLMHRTSEAVNRKLDYFKDWEMLYEYGCNLMEEISGQAREYMLTRLIFTNLNPRKAASMESVYTSMTANLKTPRYLELLEKKWARAFKFAGGSTAPDISFVSEEKKQSWLSDYRGKYVYLSFWAKWCGKCIDEMAASEANRVAAQDKEIEYLFVNVDENRADWLDHPSRESTTGTHVWTPGIKSDAAKTYEIFSLPRYYLIDPEGEFVDGFPKASDPEFVTYMKSLVQ